MTKEEIIAQNEIIEMARRAGFIDYELDDGTTNAFDKRYKAFAKLVAEKAIKEALAQPKEQEPVAWMIWGKNNVPSLTFKKPSDKYVFDSLYTTPPQRKPLTNDAARKLWSHIEGVTVSEAVTLLSVVRATEAAHGIKE